MVRIFFFFFEWCTSLILAVSTMPHDAIPSLAPLQSMKYETSRWKTPLHNPSPCGFLVCHEVFPIGICTQILWMLSSSCISPLLACPDWRSTRSSWGTTWLTCQASHLRSPCLSMSCSLRTRQAIHQSVQFQLGLYTSSWASHVPVHTSFPSKQFQRFIWSQNCW